MNRTSRAVEHWVRTAVATVAFGVVAAPSAHALGLGRLAVQSAIGESLRAEIDITSLTPEEAANLQVRVAPPESYRSAGVDYNAVLPGTQATVLRRGDGRPYVRLTSDRSVLEPFVDVILEVSWSSGRLVREYTLLFDPPSQRNLAAAPAAPVLPAAEAPPPPSAAALAAAARAAAAAEAAASAPVAAAAPPAAQAPAPAGASEPRPIATRPPVTARATPAPTPPAAAPTPAPAPAPARPPVDTATRNDAGPDSYTVHRGDTLSHIAARTQRPGVSLDQMLVSLYQGNPDAFVGANMNRLRSGAVLSVPSADAARAIQPDAARQTIQAQSADFGAYRQRLASGALPTRTDASSQKASGSVQARVDDRQKSAAAANDKLTLSKNAASAAATAAAEDAISKQKERQASSQRLAELNKNVSELTRLSAAATASVPAKVVARAASAAPSAVVAPTVAAAPSPASAAVPATRLALAVPVAPPAPVVASAPTTPAAMPPASAPIAAASAVVVAAAASPVVSVLPPVPPPVRAAASAPPVPPPETPVDSGPSWWSDTPWLLPVAGALAVALAGFGLWRARRRPLSGDVGETSFLESRLQPDSFFGASGGQRIDTHEASGGVSSSMTYSLSQLDAIGDVDPVAEADVYLAYGRDLQAEEILKEAMRGNPERLAIRVKLLEVYAKRRDTKGFEMLATQMFQLTGGTGEDWEKTQDIGAQIDPDNPLYHTGGAPSAPILGDAERSIELLGASTMPQSVLPSQSQFGTGSMLGDPFAPEPVRETAPGIDLNLDLDYAEATAPHHAAPEHAVSTGTQLDDDLSDFLGTGASQDSPDSVPSVHGRFDDAPDSVSDIAFRATEVQPPNAPPLRAAPIPASGDREPPPAPPADAPLEFDLSSISLDFDPQPRPPTAEARELDLTPTAAGELFEEDDGADPLERKLDLAQEFHQIGDLEGARELLQEVMDRANGGLKDRAQRLLHDMGV